MSDSNLHPVMQAALEPFMPADHSSSQDHAPTAGDAGVDSPPRETHSVLLCRLSERAHDLSEHANVAFWLGGYSEVSKALHIKWALDKFEEIALLVAELRAAP